MKCVLDTIMCYCPRNHPFCSFIRNLYRFISFSIFPVWEALPGSISKTRSIMNLNLLSFQFKKQPRIFVAICKTITRTPWRIKRNPILGQFVLARAGLSYLTTFRITQLRTKLTFLNITNHQNLRSFFSGFLYLKISIRRFKILLCAMA